MKKGLFILMAALVMVGVSCSDKDEIVDDEDVYRLDESTGCFKAIVKNVSPWAGSVQVVIAEAPESSNEYIPSVGSEAVILSSSELTDGILQVDDVIEFKILEFRLREYDPVSSSGPRFIILKVKPC